jgi:ribonuclease HI
MPVKITMYTDGAARGNPGPGGYGVVLISGSHRREISGGFRLTTNNRMELMAVIAGLEAIKIGNSHVTVYTDSRYVSEAVERGWVFSWEKKRFHKKKNPDLWLQFLNLYRNHQVQFIWIKGHAAIPENDRCDFLAVEASRGSNLPEDSGYVAPDDQSRLGW